MAFWAKGRTSIFLAFACGCAALPEGMALGISARAEEPPAAYLSFQEKRAARALELSKPIADCVAREDTSHPVFHGCVDWHSAVHGVWALTAYSWATGDLRYKSLIASFINSPHLKDEREHLRRDPSFEMPYGRAWLLRLAVDHRRAFNSNALDAFADDVAKSLIAYYAERAPDPYDIAYDSATWALINLYDYGVSRNRSDILDFVRAKVRDNYLKARACPLERVELSTREFMAVCTNWAWLVAKVLDGDEFEAFLARFLPSAMTIEPVARSASVHQRGLNFSRSWGLWTLYRKTGQQRFFELYRQHFETTYNNPQDWKGRYWEVGHWVAQFGMLGLIVTYYDAPATTRHEGSLAQPPRAP